MNERRIPKELQYDRPDARDESKQDTEQTEAAEDVNWLARIAKQEFHHQQVQHHLDDALQAIFRLAVQARVVRDRNLGDTSAVPCCVDRDEAMHLAVELHAIERLAPVRLQRTSVVMEMDA